MPQDTMELSNAPQEESIAPSPKEALSINDNGDISSHGISSPSQSSPVGNELNE